MASPLNPITAMIVHAFIKRELGEPLSYPGRERYVTELMDSRLLAKAIEWAANHSHDAAKNETQTQTVASPGRSTLRVLVLNPKSSLTKIPLDWLEHPAI